MIRFLCCITLSIFLLLAVTTSSAMADCANPSGVAGDIVWNETSLSPAYCNDVDWIGFPRGPEDAPDISAGFGFGCSVYGGWLYCWGNNANARTGLNTTTGSTMVPTQVGADSDWTDVSAGYDHACGVRSGRLYCWGSNGNYQTAQGTTSGSTMVPTQVGAATDWTAVQVGDNFSCGLRSPGALYCWGANNQGATGQGTTSGNTATPTQVGVATDWMFLGTGSYFICGGRSNGALYCWGWNQYGETGLNTTAGYTTTPTQVGTDTGWTSVAGGTYSGCGVRSGQLYCWGYNGDGATGLGTTTGNQLVPAQVGAATDWSFVDVGGVHSCGIRSGALYCWGSNGNARTGLNTITGNQLTPAQVGTDTNWQSVSTATSSGASSSGYRGGALYSWGSNANARTGLNTTTGNQLVPALAMGSATSCTNPVGVSGDIVFNSTHSVLQFCDGLVWWAAGPFGDGGAGCTSPVGVAGALTYNTTHNVMQYCEGSDWIKIGD
ncbi:RCC1 domain-containing protein [Micavibrio aeruginosavorus]|uniref:BNR repeat domain protein n=1 Tax=Micavibrio aeruginosavorus EPB TaxID=349215 RepID=M4VUV3_9BACT|nr:hypothetical protein [Micavibrio aeruginosavorus]AGH96964.1 BNR repeat domain protein [Micavibrio aeruginosavorus EPB]